MLDQETRQDIARRQFNTLLENGDLRDDMPTLLEDVVVVLYGEDEWAEIQKIVDGLIEQWEERS